MYSNFILARVCAFGLIFFSWAFVYADKVQEFLDPKWTVFHGKRGRLHLRLAAFAVLNLLVLAAQDWASCWGWPIAFIGLRLIIRLLRIGFVRAFGLNVWDRDGE